MRGALLMKYTAFLATILLLAMGCGGGVQQTQPDGGVAGAGGTGVVPDAGADAGEDGGMIDAGPTSCEAVPIFKAPRLAGPGTIGTGVFSGNQPWLVFDVARQAKVVDKTLSVFLFANNLTDSQGNTYPCVLANTTINFAFASVADPAKWVFVNQPVNIPPDTGIQTLHEVTVKLPADAPPGGDLLMGMRGEHLCFGTYDLLPNEPPQTWLGGMGDQPVLEAQGKNYVIRWRTDSRIVADPCGTFVGDTSATCEGGAYSIIKPKLTENRNVVVRRITQGPATVSAFSIEVRVTGTESPMGIEVDWFEDLSDPPTITNVGSLAGASFPVMDTIHTPAGEMPVVHTKLSVSSGKILYAGHRLYSNVASNSGIVGCTMSTASSGCYWLVTDSAGVTVEEVQDLYALGFTERMAIGAVVVQDGSSSPKIIGDYSKSAAMPAVPAQPEAVGVIRVITTP